MPELQVTDVQQQLSRAFSLQGPQRTSVGLDVAPVIVVGPEAGEPHGTRLRRYSMRTFNSGAVNKGICGLTNPSTSNEILVIEDWGLYVAAGAAQTLGAALVYGDAPGGTRAEDLFLAINEWFHNDMRVGVGIPPIANKNVYSAANADAIPAPQSAQHLSGPLVAATWFRYRDNGGRPIVLPPNTAYVFGPSVTNQTLSFYISGFAEEQRAK